MAKTSRRVVRGGALDGVCLYFRVVFDECVSFDTSPLHTPTHWANRYFRMQSESCKPGDVLRCELSIGDPADAYSWSVSAELAADQGDADVRRL